MPYSFMNFKGILDQVKSHGHVPVALFVFAVTTTIHVVTKKDLGPNYINSIYAFYGFLAGDKYCQGKFTPEPPKE